MIWPRPALRFTARERAVIRRCRTPTRIQHFLNRLPYNTEPPPGRATLRTFRGVIRTGTAHCLEAALTAAVIAEQHGLPPLVMSLESIDGLDHVVFVYREGGRWGSIARSRDPGLHGRRPVFRTIGDLARSYHEPYIDESGLVKAYGVVDLRVLGDYDWRLATGNVWKVEQLLFAIPHRPSRMSPDRERGLRRRFFAYKSAFPTLRPLYSDMATWSALPAEFNRRLPPGSRPK